MTRRVVLDACVLVPISLCDVLHELADARLYQPLWSETILSETWREPRVRRFVSTLGGINHGDQAPFQDRTERHAGRGTPRLAMFGASGSSDSGFRAPLVVRCSLVAAKPLISGSDPATTEHRRTCAPAERLGVLERIKR